MTESTADILARINGLIEKQQKNIDADQKIIDSYKAKNAHKTPPLEPKPTPKPKTAQEIYQAAQRGGEGWALILAEVTELWG